MGGAEIRTQESAAARREGPQLWALAIGSGYALVTLLVVGIAVVRVMAAEAAPLSGYAESWGGSARAGMVVGDDSAGRDRSALPPAD